MPKVTIMISKVLITKIRSIKYFSKSVRKCSPMPPTKTSVTQYITKFLPE